MTADTLGARVAEIAATLPAQVSVCARDLKTGRALAFHADVKGPTASVIKLPILVHTYLMAREGTLSLDEMLTMAEDDKVPPSGVITELTPGLRMSIRDLCMLMIIVSDNTATNLVMDRVGIAAVNERMRGLGLRRTTLYRRVYRVDENRTPECLRYGTGATSARDMVRLLALLAEGEIGDAGTSAAILRVLGKQQHLDGIPRFLPETCTFAGKGGAIDRVRNDVGLVTVGGDHTIALAVCCKGMPVLPYSVDHPALIAIGRIAERIVREWAPEAFAR